MKRMYNSSARRRAVLRGAGSRSNNLAMTSSARMLLAAALLALAVTLLTVKGAEAPAGLRSEYAAALKGTTTEFEEIYTSGQFHAVPILSVTTSPPSARVTEQILKKTLNNEPRKGSNI